MESKSSTGRSRFCYELWCAIGKSKTTGVNFGTFQFIINEHISRETNSSAFNLTFGDFDEIYMKLPADDGFNSASDEYVRLLANNLKSLSDPGL